MTPDCFETVMTRGNGQLICDLPRGHDGLHYDSLVHLSWKIGEPE